MLARGGPAGAAPFRATGRDAVTEFLAALADLDAGLADQAQLLGPVLDLPLGGAADTGADAEARSAARRTLLLNVFRSAARRLAAAGSTLVLVLEDLQRYPRSAISDIHQRVGGEIHPKQVKRALEELIERGEVRFEGNKRWRRYWALA